MSTLQAPQDLDAEEAILGAVIATDAGAKAGAAMVNPADFYAPTSRRLYTAALQLGIRPQFPPCCLAAVRTTYAGCEEHPDRPDTARVRAAAVATMTEVRLGYIHRLIDDRPTMRPTPSQVARVAAAARRRRLMLAAEALYQAAAAGQPSDELAGLVAELSAA